MKQPPAHVKLKDYPSWKQNQQEIEAEYKWFVRRVWPAFMIGVILTITLLCFYADKIDELF